MRKIKSIPVKHKYKRRAFVFKNLYSYTPTFLHEAIYVKKSLEHPYSNSHRLSIRSHQSPIINRIFNINIHGTKRSDSSLAR